MSTFLTLLSKDIGFKEEIISLEALHKFATDWEDIKSQFDGIDGIDDLPGLINAITNRNNDIKAALGQIGINASQLDVITNFFSRFQSHLDEIDPRLKMLLNPVGKFAETGSQNLGQVMLPLLSLEKAKKSRRKLKHIDLDLSLSGKASSSLKAEAGDILPYPGAPKPGKHLRLSIYGDLAAGADAKAPFSAGSIGFSTEASAGTALSYFFQTNPQSLYAAELIRHLPGLTSPFNYQGLVDAMSGKEMDAVAFKIEGSASGKVTLAIAQTANLFTSKLPAEIGYKFSASIEKSGFLDVVLRAERDQGAALEHVRMTLSRSKVKEKATSSSISVIVDSSELFTAVRDTLGDLLGDYKDLVKEYEEYLTPGTWLKDQAGIWAKDTLAELVKDERVKEAIGTVFGSTTATRKFQDRIENAFETAGNTVTGFFDSQVSSVEGKLKDAITRELPPALGSALGDRLDKLINDGVNTIRTELKKKVNKLVTEQQSRAEAQIRKLEDARGPIRNSIKKASGKVDKLFSGVREMLSKIEKTLQDMHDGAEKLARAKLTVAWSETTTVTDRQTIEFDASLPVTGNLEAFDDVYDQLMRGNIGDVALLLTRPDVQVHSQALEKFSGWHQQRVYNVIFMDVLIKKESIISANATVKLEGESIAVGTEAELKSWSKSKHQQQTATFMNVIDLALARSKPEDITRTFQLRLGLEHKERRFQEEEVRNFLNEFEFIGAIPGGATDRTAIAMEEKGLIERRDFEDITIGLTMNIGLAGLTALLDLDSTQHEAARYRKRIFKTSYPILRDTGTFDRQYKGKNKQQKRLRNANEVVATLASAVHITDTNKVVEILMRYKDKKKNTPKGTNLTSSGRGRQRRGEFVVNLLESLNSVLLSLREIWVSNPIEQQCDEQWYRKRQQAVAKGLDKWMQTGDVLFGGWKDGKPQHETVAFCAIIGALAGTPDKPVMMSITIKDSKMDETIVIE